MHIDFALPLAGDLMAGFDLWQKQAAAKSVMDYGLHMALTAWDGKVRGCSLAAEGALAYLPGSCETAHDAMPLHFLHSRRVSPRVAWAGNRSSLHTPQLFLPTQK